MTGNMIATDIALDILKATVLSAILASAVVFKSFQLLCIYIELRRNSHLCHAA